MTVKTLPNGVRLAVLQMPAVRSVSFGIWIRSGTRHEPPEANGASHFIEHMLFKGTKNYSAAELADRMDLLGGEINAFTTKECTCYYGRVLDVKLAETARLLADMLFESTFDEDSVKLERGVIVEEIGMYEDSPDDLAVEKLLLGVYRDTPLGRPILGKKETLANMTGAFLKDYCHSHYMGENTVIAVAGNCKEEALAEIEALFSRLPAQKGPNPGVASYQTTLSTVEKPTEQSHIALCFPSIAIGDPRRYGVQLLSNLLGGSMSSRLFQRIREQLGFCYSVYTFQSSHMDTGIFGIYLGTGRETEQQAMTEIGNELRRLVKDGVTDNELYRSKEQVKTGMLMALESTSSRMNHIGKGLLLQNRVLSPEEIAASYERVTKEDIQTLAETIFDMDKASLSLVTQKGNAQAHLDWLKG